VAVKIRLKRMGKIRAPFYRIVVADSRTKRDGRVIEEIGVYHPTRDPSVIEVNSDRAQYWLGVGAQPTEQVAALLKLTGDWGKFKGDKNAKSTVKFAEPKEEFRADAKKKPVLRPKAAKPVVEEKPAAEDVVDAPAEAPVEAAVEAPVEAPAADDAVVTLEEAPVAEEALVAEEAPAATAEEAPAEEAPAPAEEAPASDEAEQKPSE
jgi:small subunit ribosomal protein S16